MSATTAAKTTATIDPPILLPAPVNALGLGVGVAVTPPAADVTSWPKVLGQGVLGSPVPVPIPPLEAGPLGYGAIGVGTTVAVDLTILIVRYWVRVLLRVVVKGLDSDAAADDCSKAPPGTAGALVASVTRQTVVYKLLISVVTWPSFAGQLVTVGAQDVIV